MNANSQLRITVWLCVILTMIQNQPIDARVRDLCTVPPSTNGLCVPSTLGIYFDVETEHCRYMGCGKRLFGSLEDCEKICNNARHVKRRNRSGGNETTN
ncbi:uncharacterized protein LOC111079099 [Drosophila obscura]|uniref:uncharacterized protein LOC111079099 n=1 Tax=Drosophila obscura TaxID=7282 RepID=UPI001BB1F597|nr:uncharacterized protein LOC111079099 [Drosophila obscura]